MRAAFTTRQASTGPVTGPGPRGDDPLVRVRREVRWVLWGLWLACLVFSIWFFAEVITLFLQAESW